MKCNLVSEIRYGWFALREIRERFETLVWEDRFIEITRYDNGFRFK